MGTSKFKVGSVVNPKFENGEPQFSIKWLVREILADGEVRVEGTDGNLKGSGSFGHFSEDELILDYSALAGKADEPKVDFRVGDKVRYVGGGKIATEDWEGLEGFIEEVDEDGDFAVRHIPDGKPYVWLKDNVELIEAFYAPPERPQDTKATNPKDAIGSTKLPLNLVPDTLPIMAALAFTEGATKYGAFNWRVAGVRASIYEAALKRHLAKWWNGEDSDPVTGVPHLASVIACAGIILDAALAGKLTDDRPPKVAMSELIDSFEAKVKHLKELHKDKNPHHHTALDKVVLRPVDINEQTR